jgi:hypothetical protein
MRRTEASGRIARNMLTATVRTVGLAVLSLGLGVVVTAGVARAEDNDSRTFSEKVSDSFFGVIRGTSMESRGIDYRERSPLVVPPTLDLPPPAATADVPAGNWPKDPDERTRKAVIAAKKKSAPPPERVRVIANGGAVVEAAKPINIAPPVAQQDAPPAPGTTRRADAPINGREAVDPAYDKPGDLFTNGTAILGDLGSSVGLGNALGTSKLVAVEPGTEPVREALTQPPVGYQVPSAGYAYGVPQRGWLDGQSNPDRNVQAARSSASSVVH